MLGLGQPAHAVALALLLTFGAGAIGPAAAMAAPAKDRGKKGGKTKSAEQSKREEEAYALFEESEQRYREGEFLEAAKLLRLAYELDPEPTLLFNLGRALESAADLEGAAEAYRAYLDAAPKAEDRVQTERRVENLQRQIAEKRALEAARLEEAKKREALERAVRAKAGDANAASASGESTRSVDGVAKTESRVAPDERSHRLPWVVVGLGGAAAATGTVLAVLAMKAKDDATNEPTQLAASRRADDAHAFEVGAAVGWSVGGALLVGGVSWLLLDSRSESAPHASIAVGPTSFALVGAF